MKPLDEDLILVVPVPSGSVTCEGNQLKTGVFDLEVEDDRRVDEACSSERHERVH